MPQNIPGPAVAVSPTGLNLVMGPIGPPGLQGPRGPIGATGASGTATPQAPQRVVFTGSTIAITAITNTLIIVDSTSGAVALNFTPSAVTDGLQYTVKWRAGTNPVTWQAPVMVEEIPPNQGTYIAANTPQTMPGVGDSVTYYYDGTLGLWSLAG